MTLLWTILGVLGSLVVVGIALWAYDQHGQRQTERERRQFWATQHKEIP